MTNEVVRRIEGSDKAEPWGREDKKAKVREESSGHIVGSGQEIQLQGDKFYQWLVGCEGRGRRNFSPGDTPTRRITDRT